MSFKAFKCQQFFSRMNAESAESQSIAENCSITNTEDREDSQERKDPSSKRRKFEAVPTNQENA